MAALHAIHIYQESAPAWDFRPSAGGLTTDANTSPRRLNSVQAANREQEPGLGQGTEREELTMVSRRTEPTLALIVEDDPATRALEEIVLEADGFAVLTAKNGEEAIRLARERCPGVILLDLALPTVSGFDVLNTLKGNADTVGIPVVLISAYANLVENGAARGAAGCVQKPFDIDDLVSEVRRASRSVSKEPALAID
jgi:CheY-like chemotaxis protein